MIVFAAGIIRMQECHTGCICVARKQHSYASSWGSFLSKHEHDIRICFKAATLQQLSYIFSFKRIWTYRVSASADIPAHGNASEGSILRARSNACRANCFSPSCLYSYKHSIVRTPGRIFVWCCKCGKFWKKKDFLPNCQNIE